MHHSAPASSSRQMSQSRLPNGVELQQESSDDSDEAYTVESAMEDWLFQKSNKTKVWYKSIISRFRKWLHQKYQRDLDRTRKKHIKAYLSLLSETNSQVRPVLCVLKWCFKHLKRLDVIDKRSDRIVQTTAATTLQRGEESAKRTGQSNVCAKCQQKKGQNKLPSSTSVDIQRLSYWCMQPSENF